MGRCDYQQAKKKDRQESPVAASCRPLFEPLQPLRNPYTRVTKACAQYRSRAVEALSRRLVTNKSVPLRLG